MGHLNVNDCIGPLKNLRRDFNDEAAVKRSRKRRASLERPGHEVAAKKGK
jgi:hypothetical protein